ncbi:MAG TPA: DUF1365 domain-containing protein [Solirubrobacteraceae bacterium]
MTVSAIYEGTIRHRRFPVRAHEMSHRIALVYLDLDELDGLLDGRLIAGPPGLVRFRRRDYLGDPYVGLGDAVRMLLERRTGSAPAGPIRLLTHLRTFGRCFNPVSFYYCFTPQEQLEAVVAEVTSTPWGERHAYVLERSGESPALAASFAKALHVSPFMGMEQRYTLHATVPDATLAVHIESHERGELAFDATLALRRAPLSRRGLAHLTTRYPAATLRVLALIYGHALALKLKGVPLHARPREPA